MSHLIRRRTFLIGGLASTAVIRHAAAAPPATIADGTVIGPGNMIVVHEDASGRIVALDSSGYLGRHETSTRDVVSVGSYCGTQILGAMFTRGAKAVIALDAGIGKDEAGISGLRKGEELGVPVAAVAVMSAITTNGRSTLLGEISVVNAQARALGVTPGMVAYEAALRLAKAPPGKPQTIPAGIDELPVMVEESAKGKIWTAAGSLSFRDKIPNDVFCSGANSSRVFAEGCLKITPRGAIANDAGIGKNDSAIVGVRLLGEHGVAAASVSVMSARLGEGASTWNHGVISVANPVAVQRGVKVGMTAQDAARLMLQNG
jgi:hypothetical protein